MSWTAWYGGHFSWRSLSNKWNYERLDVVMKHKSIWLVHAPVSCCVVHAKAAPWQRVFVVLSMSTLTSPLSPSLFSPIDDLRCSDLVTSDEEPDLGAFTAVLRAWGYLLPPLRIHATTVHDSSSASDSPRSVEINSEVDVFSPSSELVAASTLVNDNTTESDIIMAYSPSTDQPVLDFLRPRRLRIHAQPLRPPPLSLLMIPRPLSLVYKTWPFHLFPTNLTKSQSLKLINPHSVILMKPWVLLHRNVPGGVLRGWTVPQIIACRRSEVKVRVQMTSSMSMNTSMSMNMTWMHMMRH